MIAKPSNPLRILRTLDRHLHEPCELIVYGRSALALGFDSAPRDFSSTMDVDAILPVRDLALIEANEDFWQAQAATNQELDAEGLYFTHLFEDRQVILRPDWLRHRVALPEFGLSKLRLFRPATVDLILSKTMRIDPQDKADIEFLLEQADCDAAELSEALRIAFIPPVAEIAEAFAHHREWLERRLAS